MKLKLATENPSTKWNNDDLEKALSNLKNNKSRDFEGLINEIFKENAIGTNLKHSLLKMFNLLKEQKLIPTFMNYANITTVPKKGSRIEPKNERGIFRVSVIRSILMRLIYNSKYPTIDKNMSDCQMGGRKYKSCKNNIFIVNGLIHETLKRKSMKPICLQIYDYSQMFDTIDLKQALCDLFDAGVVDDDLKLLFEANKDIMMAVKTPDGLTDRQMVNDSVLQGDTWGSLLASVQVESIGKECIEAKHYYLYKGKLPVGFLGMIDDIVGVTEAGVKAQKMNSFINLKTAEKSLRFGASKCKSMVIRKNCDICSEELNDKSTMRRHSESHHRGKLGQCEDCGETRNKKRNNIAHIKENHYSYYNKLKVDEWAVKYEENPKTGEVELIENFIGQTEIENVESQKYLGFIISSTGNNMMNINAIKKKAIGKVKLALNKLNSLHLKHYYFECAVIILNVVRAK